MYSKLFSSMFDGSLATRGPWESVIAFQQLLILSDRFGHVDMTIPAIARRTTIPEEILRKGILALLEPDPESRRSEEDGRRIMPIDPGRDWGWRIVNFAHYHSIRSAEERKAYMREYMREKRTEPKAKRVNGHASSADFEAFWSAYPRKVGKGAAQRSWKAAGATQDLLAACLSAISAQRSTEQWQRNNGQFIPHPATWLNQKRWMDQQAPGIASSPSLQRRPCDYCGQPSIGTVNARAHCRKHADDALYHVEIGDQNA